MHGKVVLVCTDRTRTWRQVTPPLAGAGNQLVHAESTERAASLIATGVVDLIVVEWPSGLDLDPIAAAAGRSVPLVVLVGETGIRSLEQLVCQRGLFHICAARPVEEAGPGRLVDPTELVVTCEKILRRDLFGLDKYLAGFGIERPVRIVKHASDRDRLIDELTAAVRALGAGRRVVESVGLVGDELVTNAVYNAPRGADGRPRYAHVDRRAKVALEAGEEVSVQFGSDGRTFGLSVADRFGALDPASLRRGIERCVTQANPIEHKPGGAGIGLYAALCHADQLVINLDAGRLTEVIALWSLARKSGGRGAGFASLHVFELGSAGLSEEDEAGSSGAASVHLSDSVKSEVLTAFTGEGGQGRVCLSASAARAEREAMEAAALAASAEVDPDVDTSVTEIPDAAPPDPTDAEIHLGMDTGELMAALTVADLETGDFVRVTRPMQKVAEPRRRPAGTGAPPVDGQEPSGLAEGASQASDAAVLSGPPLAELYEVATAMDANGLLDGQTPPWVGPLTPLRGVQIPRAAEAPDFEAALAGLRGAVTLAEAIESLLTHLVAEWSAAMLLCRLGDSLMPWTAAGDVDRWEELCEIEVPVAPGWLSARTLSPGVTVAALDDDPSARRLGDTLTLPRVDQGLAISFVLDQAVLVVFACRAGAGAGGELALYEDLQRELAELTARVDRTARPATGRRQTLRAGAW